MVMIVVMKFTAPRIVPNPARPRPKTHRLPPRPGVKVVSQADYEAHIQDLKDLGQTGRLGPEYNANTNLPGNGATTSQG